MLLQAIRDELRDGQAATPEATEMLLQALDQGKRIAAIVASLQQVTQPKYKAYIGKTQMLDIGTAAARQAQQ